MIDDCSIDNTKKAIGDFNDKQIKYIQNTYTGYLSINTSKVLGLENSLIKDGKKANMTLFILNRTTSITEKENVSKSKSTPFYGNVLNGKVVGIVNNDMLLS